MDEFEVVETQYGQVKGVHKKSCLGKAYISFQGIPYMKAPLGFLRFRDAQPPKPWKEPFNATEEPPIYCQLNMMMREKEGQENAGTINVYTRSIKRENLYPVMVFIHGGSFSRGTSQTDVYGPDYFMEKDVILVNFNYRLGAFGFLSLNDRSLGIPGNAGLKDQLFALKWIQANIENFGGNKDNITLFGVSSGASSAHYMTVIAQAEGLFHRVIFMSGSYFSKSKSIVPRSHIEKFADDLARKLGWKGKKGDEKSLLEFLEGVPAFDIVTESMTLVSNDDQFKDGVSIPFGPCVEPYKSANCLIDKDPTLLAQQAWSKNIDVIISGCSMEGILVASLREEVANYYFQNSPAYLLPLSELDLLPTDPTAIEYGERLKSLYYKNGKEPSVENQEQYLMHQGDFLFWHGIYRAIASRIKHATGKTFVLRFHVDGALNVYKIMRNCAHYKGACHADDLFYLFHSVYAEKPSRDSLEFKVIEKMVGIYTNFATNSSPNCHEIEPTVFTPQTNADELKCVQITENDVTEVFLPELSRLRVWNSIYDEHDVALY